MVDLVGVNCKLRDLDTRFEGKSDQGLLTILLDLALLTWTPTVSRASGYFYDDSQR
jgi:hypothetical protein